MGTPSCNRPPSNVVFPGLASTRGQLQHRLIGAKKGLGSRPSVPFWLCIDRGSLAELKALTNGDFDDGILYMARDLASWIPPAPNPYNHSPRSDPLLRN